MGNKVKRSISLNTVPLGNSDGTSHRRKPSNQGAFNKLPTEILWQIAGYLHSDKDLCALRSVCQVTRRCIDGGFWHSRFRSRYALNVDTAPPHRFLRKEYQNRCKWLNRGLVVDFRGGGTLKHELGVLHALRKLITESFSGDYYYDDNDRPRCPNQDHIIKFLMNSKAFVRLNSKKNTTEEYYAIMLTCSQLLFNFNALNPGLLSFEDSQVMVYSHFKDHPIFLGTGNLQVNMKWVMHCFSFFHRHMMFKCTQTIYSQMQELPICQSPSAWQEPLKDGPYKLPRYWKGTYSYLDLDDLRRLRALAEEGGGNFIDMNIDTDTAIQELELCFPDGEISWPGAFERRLQSRRQTVNPRTRAQHRGGDPTGPKSLRIHGLGVDAEDDFFASGWINPLAPQHSITGWQRITMMKHFNPDYSQVHTDDLWAYEGVVLPGGRIILGRWWNATPEVDHPEYGYNSGPFIWWAVDYVDNIMDTEGYTEASQAMTAGH